MGTLGEQLNRYLRENWFFLLLVGGIVGGFLFLRTPASAVASVEQVEAHLQNGQPTLVEF